MYAGDTPWPAPAGHRLHLVEGELLLICDPLFAPGPPIDLPQALHESANATYVLPASLSPSDYNWVLSDGVHTAVPVRSDHFATDSLHVARALALPAGHFMLVPADPIIENHANRGTHSQGVFVACQTADYPPVGPGKGTPYVFDQRAVLLPLSWAYAAEGRLDVGALCDRLAGSCPRGYHIRLYGGSFEGDQGNHFRYVMPGEVITVEFQPNYVREVTSQLHPATYAHPATSFADRAGAIRGNFNASSSSCTDAGTGSTQGGNRAAGSRTPPSDTVASMPTTAHQRHNHQSASAPSPPSEETFSHLRRHDADVPEGSRQLSSAGMLPKLLRAVVALTVLVTGSGGMNIPTALEPPQVPAPVPAVLDLSCTLFRVDAIPLPGPATDQAAVGDRRKLPTPCRSLRVAACNNVDVADVTAGLCDSEFSCLEGLRTLLQESLADTACPALWLTATLLETLVEHFDQVGTRGGTSPLVTPLCLAQHLSAPVFDIDNASVALPHQPSLLALLFCRWPQHWAVLPDVECQQWPATTQTALVDLPKWDKLLVPTQQSALDFTLYTDGSANMHTTCSGYGVAVLVHAHDQTALLGVLGAQLLGNPTCPWLPEGPPALHAENVAIAAALLWIMQMRAVLSDVRCTIMFDCTAAGWSAEGTWQPSGPTAHIVHHLDMVARATPGIHLTYAHVKGHSGHPWNDLADYAAKTAAGGIACWPEPPTAVCHALISNDLTWLAPEQDARRHHAVPIYDGNLVWTSAPSHSPALEPEQLVPTIVSSGAEPVATPSAYQLLAATINVQSLRDKCKYVEEQLDDKQVNIAFMQETKIAGGTVTSRHYLRLQTDSDSHWGVAVWIHRRLGILQLGDTPLKVEESDIAVIHESPRLLVLLITVGELKIGVFSGHCPHGSRPTERAAFLQLVQPLLHRLKHVHLLLGGADLNARVPTGFEGVSGSLEFGEPDETGWRIAAMLAELGLWLPSTFSPIHCGDSATYTHPNGQQHRIDYLLVGGTAVVEQARSEIDDSFDNCSPQEDHKLLQLSIGGHLDATACSRRLARPKYDRDKILSLEGRSILRQLLSEFPHPSWEVGVDQHCSTIEAYMRKALDAHFALPPAQKRASYIPEKVWILRGQKVSFKHRVRHRAKLWLDLQSRAFAQWSQQQDYSVVPLVEKHSLLYDLAAAAVKYTTARIKREVRNAKNTFLRGVAGEGHQGAAKILQRVKKAGMGGTKSRPISRPLPLLLHPEDGSVARTRKHRDDIWMLHFGKQEQGETIDTRNFLQSAHFSCFSEEVEWPADLLPNYSDIETVLRDIPRNKAAGLDNLPGEVLKAVPSEAARLIFPLMLKSMLHQHQPVQWRGGILYEAFKRSGLQSSVDNYRSLFVSNYMAKAYHRVVRNKTQMSTRDELHSLHFGSRKHAPVTFAAMFVLAHFRRSHQLRHSASVLYLDTSAAYYRIVRELAMGDIRSDETVVQLFRRFGLDGDDLREMMATVEDGGMLAQAGTPAALCQVVKDIHLNTWFVSRFSDGQQVCSSLAGSRPGESFADLVFAYIYGRVLHKIQEYVVAENLSYQVPYDCATGIYADEPGDENLDITDATWADDSAFPLAAPDPMVLLHNTRRLCSLVISFCEGHGMAPNLKPGKTSVMMRLYGRGSQQARQAFFPGGTQKLWLPDLDVSITVTDQYKHLGGIVDMKLTMRPEMRFRLAQASSAYDTAKRLLLNNPQLELPVRARLFESSITPTFFNVGLWIPTGPTWDALCSGYSKLVRRLLITTVGAHAALHMPLPIAHWCTGCWRMELVARRARFSILISLVQAGPPLLWAILQSEGTWCATLRLDLAWLVKGDETSWPGTSAPAWPEWFHLIKASTPSFRRRLRQRLCHEHTAQGHEDAAVLCQWHCCRTLRARTDAPMQHFDWVCLMCRRRVRTRAALGAHFFKVHGRIAKYRLVAEGTTCTACSTNFWTEGRLAAHLRTSPGCVAQLQQDGKSAALITPGFGSKHRRKHESAAYTLSVPYRQGNIPPAPTAVCWSAAQKEVYRDLSNALLAIDRDADPSTLPAVVASVTRQQPLFPDEVLSVLNRAAEEVQLLHADDPEDPWDAPTAEGILQAIASVRSGLWTNTDATHASGIFHSLREFRSMLQTFDWQPRLSGLRHNDGTPAPHHFEVPCGWEAEWRRHLESVAVSAVVKDFGVLLPVVLQNAWKAMIQGCTACIHAPREFWDHPLATPFLGARSFSARSN